MPSRLNATSFPFKRILPDYPIHNQTCKWKLSSVSVSKSVNALSRNALLLSNLHLPSTIVPQLVANYPEHFDSLAKLDLRNPPIYRFLIHFLPREIFWNSENWRSMNGMEEVITSARTNREKLLLTLFPSYNCGRILRESTRWIRLFIRSRQQRFRCRRGNIPEIGPTKKLPPKWYLFKEGESALAKLETWPVFKFRPVRTLHFAPDFTTVLGTCCAGFPGINFAISIGIDPPLIAALSPDLERLTK